MVALGGDDLIAGAEGDDSILGGAGDDYLAGGGDSDTLLGGDDNDVLNGIPGNDCMYGGAGSDTVQMDGGPDGHVWVPTAGGWNVLDTNPNDGDDGSDFVASDVEWVEYTGTGEVQATPCFAAGTRIMTARGEVAVQALRAGDLVVTLGLQGPWLRPVRWIGRRSVDCRRHPRPAAVLPVRILAGALGPGVPRRDLVVSPDHGLYLDGVLVPAAALVDGSRILRDSATRRVRYFHIELDAHDVLLAEGAPAESWLDCDNRGQFENAGLVVALHADFAAAGTGARGCAPRVEAGPALERIRLRIARVDASAATGTIRRQA
jgi:hypothetical protein